MPELLERGSQLGILSDRFQAAAAGRGQTVLLGGEAGSGKTSLIAAFLARAPVGVTVRHASCDAAGILGPLGPILDIAETFGPRASDAAQQNLSVDRVARSILGELRAATEPNVLIAEDIHWADQSTLDLLRFLARRIDDTHTLLIASFRDDALEPDHELRLFVGELLSQSTVSRVSLPPLSFDAVSTLTAPGGLDPEAVFALTSGNPYFVAEIVNARSETIPGSIRDVVLSRVARLDAESRAVLEFAAVAGPSLDPRFLRSVYGQDIASALERGMHLGLLRSTSDGILFRHAITRDIVLAEMSSLRRADIARRILAELERGQSGTCDAALLAHFADEADDAAAVNQYAPIAARDAARAGAHRQAALQYNRALCYASTLDEEEVATLLEARSFELHLISQTDRAIEDISRAIQIRMQHGETASLGDDLRRRSRYNWIDGRNAASEADALAALDALERLEPSVALAMAYSNLSQLRMLSNETEDAIAWGTRALELAVALDAPHVKLHAMTNVGSALVMADRDGWSTLAEAEQLGRQLELHDDVARTFTNRAYSALDLHQLSRAIAFAREGIAYTDEHDIFALGHYLHGLLATAQLESGERDGPEREFKRLLEIPNLIATTRVVCLTSLGLLRARAGAPAFELLDEALDMATRIGELQRLGPVRAARAEALWLVHDLDAARAEACVGLERSRTTGNRWLNGKLTLWLVRSGGTPLPGLELAEPYRLEIEGQFHAAAEWWKASGFPLQRARALAGEGTTEALRAALEILHGLDDRPDARRVSERLRSMGETGIPQGFRARTKGNPAHLTDREIEVLELLALGKSNREIADTLFISPRTCGHHVSAILAKLGVQSRALAAERAYELGLKNRSYPPDK